MQKPQRLVCIVEGKGEVQAYDPMTHQLELTRRIDVTRLRKRSRSFDKLVRTLGSLCSVPVPSRPS